MAGLWHGRLKHFRAILFITKLKVEVSHLIAVARVPRKRLPGSRTLRIPPLPTEATEWIVSSYVVDRELLMAEIRSLMETYANQGLSGTFRADLN